MIEEKINKNHEKFIRGINNTKQFDKNNQLIEN